MHVYIFIICMYIFTHRNKFILSYMPNQISNKLKDKSIYLFYLIFNSSYSLYYSLKVFTNQRAGRTDLEVRKKYGLKLWLCHFLALKSWPYYCPLRLSCLIYKAHPIYCTAFL